MERIKNFWEKRSSRQKNWAGSLAAILAGVPLWNYSANHDVSMDSGHTLTLRKMDGWFAHSEVRIAYSRNEVIIEKSDLWDGYKRFSADRNGNLTFVTIDTPFFWKTGIAGTFSYENETDVRYHLPLLNEEKANFRKEMAEFIGLYKERYSLKFEKLGLSDKTTYKTKQKPL